MRNDEALAALSGVQDAQNRLAADIECPPWRHAAMGGFFAVLIGSIAISSQAQMAMMPLVMLGLILLVRSDRKRMGLFVNGYRRGRTLPVSLACLAIMLTLVFAAMHMRNHDFLLASKAALAVIAAIAGTAFSVVWQRVYRRELRGDVG